MPKLKCASSSLTASRAKKRKKEIPERLQQDSDSDENDIRQETDDVRQEMRRLRNTEARRIARLDPLRRQQEQARNTEARRRVRQQDSERRQEEQARNTAARRRVCQQDSESRQEEQARNTAVRRRVRQQDCDSRQEEQARNTAARRRVRLEDPERRREEQTRNTTARRRVHEEDPQHCAQEQQINNARRQQVRASRLTNFRALNYQPENFVNTTSFGLLTDVECPNCGALKKLKDFVAQKAMSNKMYSNNHHHFLQHLYEGTGSDSNHFLSNIRKYNSTFQMTSFGCNEVCMVGFNPSFRIQGQVYHLIGSMFPTAGESPKFAQIYFIDNQESEVAARCAIVDGLRPTIVRSINELLINENHYVDVFKIAKEIFEQQDSPTNIKIVINETGDLLVSILGGITVL